MKPFIYSFTLRGIEAIPVTIETDVSFGMSSFQIVGLPDTAVKEARDRIRSALKHSGYAFPRTRITVNLAPGDIRKQGSHYDLPIAISLLYADGQIKKPLYNSILLFGELALNGTIRSVPGVLSAMLMTHSHPVDACFTGKENAKEAVSVNHPQLFVAKTLKEVIEHLEDTHPIPHELKTIDEPPPEDNFLMDFQDIKGQSQAKRALEIAAAGGHNILLKGPPGTGKTLLAKTLPSLLPSLSHNEALEVSAIASVAGLPSHPSGIARTRPMRSPHHSSSAIALVGGGSQLKPGEVSLAHRGILFLDELPEFSRHSLEHLRQPIEDGYVHISRASGSVCFPSRFLLVAAMNPCPCGYATDPRRNCSCSHRALEHYRRRLSGPLLDRFDLILEVPNIEAKILLNKSQEESSAKAKLRVEKARDQQKKRFASSTWLTNAEIPVSQIDTWCQIPEEANKLLEQAMHNQSLSARGFARIKKVARTIADLDEQTDISVTHIAEALQYRVTV